MERNSHIVSVGTVSMGSSLPIVVQTMCNTHTNDVPACLEQCRRLAAAGAQLIRLTCPGLSDVPHIAEIRRTLRSEGIDVPLVADIHFSARTAIAVAPFVEKVRINPGNFHIDFNEAKKLLSELIQVCKRNGTAIRIGLNHGSLGERITALYGNTPEAMAIAAMEWLELCRDEDFDAVVVSLKASNTIVMVNAYRQLAAKMQAAGMSYPLHVGVTEAGGGDAGRIKSCVGISALLSEGLGDTLRVSLTEDPEAEIPVAGYLSDRYSYGLKSSLVSLSIQGRKAVAIYDAPSRERLLMDFSCDFGKRLLDRELDQIEIGGYYHEDDHKLAIGQEFADYLVDELMQACRRRFYRPEYIACPGCGRTMYRLQETLEEVQKRTSHLRNVVIAVMGCIVNGPGEMADADWGYVGEGGGKVTIYRGKEPIMKHIPDSEAVDVLVKLIEGSQKD